MSYRFAYGTRGEPVLLAAVPAEPPEDVPAPGEKKRQEESSHRRRRDAVVDAARQVEDLSPAGVEQFARRRWRGDRPITPEDISAFSADARAQRVHDVVDALDFRVRRAVYGRAGSKQMHVSIPRGIVGKSLAALDGEEVAQVVERLRDRGWTDDQVRKHAVRRFLASNEHLGKLLSTSGQG
jgi:hypothetical protein